MKFDLESELKINPYKLKEECVSHSGLYYKYSDACREAKDKVSRAKDNFELVKSQRELEIRRECKDKGEKTTEKIIEAMVNSDSEVVEARNNLREVEDVYASLQVAVGVMQTRKDELDNLVKLAVSNYYSTTGKNNFEGSDEMIRHDIRKSMNREEDYD